jgi:branched-chain amino acid aminotransferase
MPGLFIHNGKFHQEHDAVISPDNRSFRYGDGVFETIRFHKHQMPLWNYHQQRLFGALDYLKFNVPKLLTADYLHNLILALIKKNDLTNARVRITMYRGEGGLTDKNPLQPGFVIQTWPIAEEALSLNVNGLRLGIFREGRKAIDYYSHLKTNNFLVYTQAALEAREQKWNDALVLNSENRIADSAIANIYWVKDNHIFTPPLSEAPIQGVMRRFLLEQLPIHEHPLTIEALEQADEVFLTNAVRGIQWVAFVGDTPYPTQITAATLYKDHIAPLFS